MNKKLSRLHTILIFPVTDKLNNNWLVSFISNFSFFVSLLLSNLFSALLLNFNRRKTSHVKQSRDQTSRSFNEFVTTESLGDLFHQKSITLQETKFHIFSPTKHKTFRFHISRCSHIATWNPNDKFCLWTPK